MRIAATIEFLYAVEHVEGGVHKILIKKAG
jgi:hypothetical protein